MVVWFFMSYFAEEAVTQTNLGTKRPKTFPGSKNERKSGSVYKVFKSLITASSMTLRHQHYTLDNTVKVVYALD